MLELSALTNAERATLERYTNDVNAAQRTTTTLSVEQVAIGLLKVALRNQARHYRKLDTEIATVATAAQERPPA